MEKIIGGGGVNFLLLQLMDEKSNKPQYKWMNRLFDNLNGDKLLGDLKFEEIMGQNHNFMSLSTSDFEHLLQYVAPKITKQDTKGY